MNAKRAKEQADRYNSSTYTYEALVATFDELVKEKACSGQYSLGVDVTFYDEKIVEKLVSELKKEGFKVKYTRSFFPSLNVSWTNV